MHVVALFDIAYAPDSSDYAALADTLRHHDGTDSTVRHRVCGDMRGYSYSYLDLVWL